MNKISRKRKHPEIIESNEKASNRDTEEKDKLSHFRYKESSPKKRSKKIEASAVDSKYIIELNRIKRIKKDKDEKEINFASNSPKRRSKSESRGYFINDGSTNKEIFEDVSSEKWYTDSKGSEMSESQLKILSSFSSILDSFEEVVEDGDGNWLFRALSRGLSGNPEHYKKIRSAVWNHIKNNRDRFLSFITTDFNDYIRKMRRNKVWGGEIEIIAFTELYWTNVAVHDLITSPDPRYFYKNSNSNYTIRLMYRNRQHYNSLIPLDEKNLMLKKNSKLKESEKIVPSLLIKYSKDMDFVWEEDKYSSKSFLAIFNYCKGRLECDNVNYNEKGCWPEGILNIKDKDTRDKWKRYFREKCGVNKKYKVVRDTNDSNEDLMLMKNWENQEKNTDSKEESKNESKTDSLKLKEKWKIIPRKWEVKNILYHAHTMHGSHLMIRPTVNQLEENGYKWKNMEKDVREMYFSWEVRQSRYQMPKKNQPIHFIQTSKPKERYVVDTVYLSDYIVKKKRYLITMVDHFSKYGWAKVIKDKKQETILKSLKGFFSTHYYPDMLHSDNGKEFDNELIKGYLNSHKIKYIKGSPYHPQSQGSVESFNKYIQIFLVKSKDHLKDKFDLENSVYDFLLYYNKKKHSTTKYSPYDIIEWNDVRQLEKVVENTEESRRRAKENQVLFSTDEEVRISNLLSIDLEQMKARYITKGMAKNLKKNNGIY